MVEPAPGAAQVDVHVLPVVGGVDHHDALHVDAAAGGVVGVHVYLEGQCRAGVELEVDDACV